MRASVLLPAGVVTSARRSVYDSGNYYADDGSRLSPAFDGLLRVLDGWRARAVVRKTGLSTGRILDVGAGDGKFLHFMKRLGFEVQGTTTSRKSASAAHARFGLSLDNSDNLNHLPQAAPFDLVTYWHVYEHIQDPHAHANQWPDLIRAGGFIIIEVPNARSIGARLCREAWLGADEKHHVNHQAPEIVLATLREVGFEAVRIEQFSGKYSYPYLWSALLGRLFGRWYDFDGIIGVLKAPLRMIRARPLWTINALASIGYLAPAVLALMLYGQVTHQGEVLRVYARRRAPDNRSKAEIR